MGVRGTRHLWLPLPFFFLAKKTTCKVATRATKSDHHVELYAAERESMKRLHILQPTRERKRPAKPFDRAAWCGRERAFLRLKRKDGPSTRSGSARTSHVRTSHARHTEQSVRRQNLLRFASASRRTARGQTVPCHAMYMTKGTTFTSCRHYKCSVFW